MRMNNKYILTSLLSLGLTLGAQITKAASSEASALPKCKSSEARKAQVGYKCLTSEGGVYERVQRDGFGEAWKSSTGLIWSDLIGELAFRDAKKACEALNSHVPDYDEFYYDKKLAFKEVVPHTSTTIVTSSIYSYDYGEVWFMVASTSFFQAQASTNASVKTAFRCVAK